MRPQLFKLPYAKDTSFYYSKYDCDYFEKPWHFHKEFELVYIIKSKGTKFIGNKVLSFDEGDLTLIGADVPHLFRNDEIYYEQNFKNQASCIFIHFDPSVWGGQFIELPEFKKVKKILKEASLALTIEGNTKKLIVDKLERMEALDSTKKILSLLEILEILSTGEDVSTILNVPFVGKSNHHADRINKVFDYIMLNYTQEIYVKQIADELHMSTSAFSRYFKTHTSKTFSDYVTEIRINFACKLLIEDNFSVSEIGFMSGFENRTNFYRHFKKQVGMVPKDYKSAFEKVK
ncbi:MAG TPA: AraC family transcriptional regulator [Cytophagaceae bacterium]